MSQEVQLSPATSSSPIVTLPSPASAGHLIEARACRSRWPCAEGDTTGACYCRTSEIRSERPFSRSCHGFPAGTGAMEPILARFPASLPGGQPRGANGPHPEGAPRYLPSRPSRSPPDKLLTAIDRRCTSDAPGIDLAETCAAIGAQASAATTPTHPILHERALLWSVSGGSRRASDQGRAELNRRLLFWAGCFPSSFCLLAPL
jgi:hypothetical protein